MHGQSSPFGTVQNAWAVFPLAPLLKGQRCPERQANTNSAAPGLRVGRGPQPHPYKYHIYSPGGAAAGTVHMKGSAAAMALLSLHVSREAQGVESTQNVGSGGLRDKEGGNGSTKHTGLGPPNPSVKFGKCGGDQVGHQSPFPASLPSPGWGS